MKELRNQYHTELQLRAYEEMQKRNEEAEKQYTEMQIMAMK